MKNTDKKIKTLWDERSAKYKDDIAGVLPKSFPLVVNQAIDDWEFGLISGLIKNKTGYNILDVGCGYGRVSERILKKFDKVETTGIDIAKNYVNLFNKKMKPRGKALVADMRKIPLKNESVDLVLVITAFMYCVTKEDQKKAFNEIFRVLKKDGKILLIERDVAGYNLITLGGIVGKIRGQMNKEITAVGFDPKDIEKLAIKNGGKIESKSGMPAFTLSLPVFFVLNKLSNKSLLKAYLKFTQKLDRLFGKIVYPSLYIAYTISKV